MTGLLDGFVIVELADQLTEYGGLLLSGLGAEVYLVEAPGGAPTRARGPFVPGLESSRRSIPFLARNAGKRSLTFDPDNAAEMMQLGQLMESADGVIAGANSPFSKPTAGVAPNTPRVDVTDADALGTSSIVAFAASGGLSSSGWPHQPPCNAPGWLALDGASIYAAVMLLVSMRNGRGDAGRWEVPLHEAAIATATPWTRPLHSYGMTAAGQGRGSARTGPFPYPILPTADGFIRFLTGTPRQWDALVELLGRPEVLTQPEWQAPAFRAQNFEAMSTIAAEVLATRKTMDVFLEGQALGLTITPMFAIDEFMRDAHVNARQLFTTVDDPDLGPVRMMRPAYRYADGSSHLPDPAPATGAANDALPGLVAREPQVSPVAPPANPVAPLAGLRVLDCGVGAVVPEAASLLALLGAHVIKVESRKHLDFLRQSGLGGFGDFNNACTFNQMNLGVESLAIDLTTEEGKAVLKRLAATCDIVLENLRGPVMGKWGASYEELRAVRPDIIYMSSQGLGDGPYGGFQTYGPNLQTFSGVARSWAHPDDPYPVGSTLNHPDHVAGKQFLTAVLAAVIRRDRTGEGCYLDCAQFEAAAALIADRFLQEQVIPGSAKGIGNISHDMAPHGCYPTRGDDLWCALAVEDDEQWRRFATAVAERWTSDARFAASAGRIAAREELDALVAAWTASRSQEEIENVLRAARVPVSRVVRGDDLAADESLHADGIFACVPHPTAGPRWHTGLPIVHARAGRIPLRRAPLLGEHDERTLIDLLDMAPSEVSKLAASGVIGH